MLPGREVRHEQRVRSTCRWWGDVAGVKGHLARTERGEHPMFQVKILTSRKFPENLSSGQK